MAKIQLKVIKNLDDIDRTVKRIKDVNRVVFAAAALSKKELAGNWTDGKGGDGRAWQGRGLSHNASELSPSYKEFKAKAGRDPIPSMHLSGQMVRSLTPKKTGTNEASLKFIGGENKKKASNNHNLRPNMFILSTQFKNKMVKLIRKFVVPFS